MGQNASPALLNIGCGAIRLPGWIGVDAYGDPDIRHDLNETPWPFEDNSVDAILAAHVFEHLENWWGAFCECARILKPFGTLDFRVPHDSSSTALTYRDHLHIFAANSFHGIYGSGCGTNAWAKEQNSIPLRMMSHTLVPFPPYQKLFSVLPSLGSFCARHMRNFIHEQRFLFVKEYAV